MQTNKKWDVLYIKDANSEFDDESAMFKTHFAKVDKALGREEALDFFAKNRYDIVIGDLSVNPIEIAFMKQIQDLKPEQSIFVLVSPKDTDKLYGIADLGVHAFELEPSQFDQALETIAQFDPYTVQS